MDITRKYKKFYNLDVRKFGDSIHIWNYSGNKDKDVVERGFRALLAECPNTKTLNIDFVRITPRIGAMIAEMPKLSFLSLHASSWDSLTVFQEAKCLEALSLRRLWHDPKSLEGLDKLKHLKFLVAESDSLFDEHFALLEPLKELEELYLFSGDGGDWPAFSQIRDISMLGRLPKLHTLDLDFAGKTLDSFTGLTHLKTLILNLKHDKLDLTPMGKLTQLEVLKLSGHSLYGYRYITDISSLAPLVNLKALNVSWEGVKSLAPLEGMKKLQWLDCASNHIRSVKPLEKLSELRELDISRNSIRSIEPLSKLPNLEALSFADNPISEDAVQFGLPDRAPTWKAHGSDRSIFQPW